MMNPPILLNHLFAWRALMACALCISVACANSPDAQLSDTQEASTDALTAATGTLTLNQKSSFCVDVRGAATSNGTAVQIYQCNGTGAQTWTQNGNTLRSLGKCLTVTGNPSNGSKLAISDCTAGADAQQFKLSGSNISMLSHALCMDVTNSVIANSTQLQVWACDTANTNQQWTSHMPAATTTTTTSTTTSTGSCKRGIAYGGNSAADMKALAPGISWWYNWSTAPESAVASVHSGLNVEFVPMVWGGSFDDDSVIATVSGNYLLAFNEPNYNAQSNLTPTQAAALWPRIEAIAKAKNLKIVSPAVNYCGTGCNVASPYDWLDQFFAACTNCKVDYLAFHWYACSKDALTYELGQFESRYKRPIWLTEFSCMDSGTVTDAVQTQYMTDALTILEADPNVYRYAWFTGRWGTSNIALLGSDGQLTTMGKAYVNFPQTCKR